LSDYLCLLLLRQLKLISSWPWPRMPLYAVDYSNTSEVFRSWSDNVIGRIKISVPYMRRFRLSLTVNRGCFHWKEKGWKLYMEVIAVQQENDSELVNRLCRQSSELLNTRADINH
jgi:hypothetical protein